MPELPEVETSRRGIAPHLTGQRIERIVVRQRHLRWPIPRALENGMTGQVISQVGRRGKYLLLETAAGTAILHLGMSGSLRILPAETLAGKHDHVDICLASGRCLRLTDPRRFGALLWTRRDPEGHKLLASLGPEPLGDEFTTDYLFGKSRGRKLAIKPFIMDSKVVVGIGNIYANEALFLAGIHPQRAAGRISRQRFTDLVDAIKTVLQASIDMGGTTLRDFVGGDGKPGYFSQTLRVYGRAGLPCPVCDRPLKEARTGQRSTVYCPHCQR